MVADTSQRDGEMRWRPMAAAPKDGSRIIVTIRGSEQGLADVDVVRWSTPKAAGQACWVSTDSTFDCAIFYGEGEVMHWMPLPGSMPDRKTSNMASRLPPFPQDGEEIGGSGI